MVIAFVGLLIFGKRLPDVARSLGKSVVEFKKGIRDVQDEVTSAGSTNASDRKLEAKPPPTLDPPKAQSDPNEE
ncbi:MAG: twin-arginine translocase TatA/TatE family subunit [Planctomycetes bacterium]|nr:twin-arginine translocase TatA/TatE family subunit [Planctomycetota bacterium]